jgi:2-oxoglutarate dehydrogenase E2 component (dihydrolipoamide succinyltransferase)
MPSAAKLLSEQGIAVGEVDGSGRGGRVTKGDVLAHVAAAAARERRGRGGAAGGTCCQRSRSRRWHWLPAECQPGADDRACGRVSPSAWSSRSRRTATLTTFNEVNMQPVMELRKRYGERFEKDHGVEARLHGRSSSRRRAPR